MFSLETLRPFWLQLARSPFVAGKGPYGDGKAWAEKILAAPWANGKEQVAAHAAKPAAAAPADGAAAAAVPVLVAAADVEEAAAAPADGAVAAVVPVLVAAADVEEAAAAPADGAAAFATHALVAAAEVEAAAASDVAVVAATRSTTAAELASAIAAEEPASAVRPRSLADDVADWDATFASPRLSGPHYFGIPGKRPRGQANEEEQGREEAAPEVKRQRTPAQFPEESPGAGSREVTAGAVAALNATPSSQTNHQQQQQHQEGGWGDPAELLTTGARFARGHVRGDPQSILGDRHDYW